MRFLACLDNEKGTHTIYEIVNNKPMKIVVHPMAIEPKPEAKKPEANKKAK